MLLNQLLTRMSNEKASDLFITVGFPPSAKIDGEMTPLAETPLSKERALEIVESAMTEKQKQQFHDERECNFAIPLAGVGRFRISAFWQRDSAGMVCRKIETQIPDPDSLGLPPTLKETVMAKRGLLLFVGATGTGKSTSLAALLGHRNRNSRGHILTIEDPIEFVHQHEKSLVTQREVGLDTESFDAALKSALRQAPDVILIGEIRSMETMEFALSFAETGHLCLATLHANNANQALDRIMHLAPTEKHNQLLFDLSFNLRGIVAQQLVPRRDGNGRRAAIEILLNTPMIGEHIRRNEMHLIKETITKSREQGMQTFDQALFDLYQAGEISYADALHYADSPNDLRLMIKLQGDEPGGGSGFLDGVTLDNDDDDF
ncbi:MULTISPECIES: PilT/PilU family type 4a pilus ATPase [Corallincola]|uniref:PilT/PilU family type 4a pilus ATPase n=3 Tax=Corallincola TaxID=1775176 RepID=A0A368N526_9GAMM|nr:MULTISPECIES: PilT/PilU family type 4a pilus ATPase [Corallincola]RCU45652.1 PilT/PilU family type 4a pilus ATPase [Corallincola holothuriorum]TAA41886.1 PilT/PilU family type 4a pilus ATPase [Corallincola spongiicola]TCI02290.1 PilT/PilU family type 4a pilus ATPase [Corallincola luteus]